MRSAATPAAAAAASAAVGGNDGAGGHVPPLLRGTVVFAPGAAGVAGDSPRLCVTHIHTVTN